MRASEQSWAAEVSRVRVRDAFGLAMVVLACIAAGLVGQHGLAAGRNDVAVLATLAETSSAAHRVVEAARRTDVPHPKAERVLELHSAVMHLEAQQRKLGNLEGWSSVRTGVSAEHALRTVGSATPPRSAQADEPGFEPGFERGSKADATLALDLILATATARKLADLPLEAVNERAALTERLRASEAGVRRQLTAALEQVRIAAAQRNERVRWLSFGMFAMVAAALTLQVVSVFRPSLGESVDERRAWGAELEVLEAADQERARLGQEMHDGLCQHLGGLRLLSRAARASSEDAATQRSLDLIAELAERSLNMTRTFSHGLYPGDVRADNLAAAIERLGNEAAQTDAFRVSLSVHAKHVPQLEDADAMHVYRIAQEALSNACRHGSPSEVAIRLISGEDGLRLCVEDDGVGMSTTVDTMAGAGMSSMRARARALGAKLSISSMPGQGTRVDLSLGLGAPRS